jgi:probable HAF family extracellular repeat protein
MQLKPLTLALLTLGLLGQAQADGHPARFEFTSLDTLGGSTGYARGISDLGQVAGFAMTSGNTTVHAALWDNGSVLDLGTLGGAFSHAYGIGPDGSVVGGAQDANGNHESAFIWRNGAMQDLGSLGGYGSWALAMNARGQVAGQALTADGGQRAFLWTGGNLQDLGTLGGGSSGALGINSLGQVAGFADTATGSSHAALWHDGTVQDLGSLAGAGGNSFATGVNDAGQVAGYSETRGGNEHAFLFAGGHLQDLGTLGGGNSQAKAIGAGGQVVGKAQVAGGAYHAFVHDGGRMVDLNALAPTGWTFTEAVGINRYGQIAGNGVQGGQARAFQLTLHPDWQGGDGDWEGPGAGHWVYGGLGTLAIDPGLPHDVVIKPLASATVRGGRQVLVRSLTVGGMPGEIVTLDLNGGTTATRDGTLLEANAQVRGHGRLAGGLQAMAGSRISVAGGQQMQLTGGSFINAGQVHVLGSGFAPAVLEVGGDTQNSGQINLQNAQVAFAGGLANTGQVNATFGTSNLTGAIDNQGGRIVVANGAAVSFYDQLVNNGELRVSAGGAANFFGLVKGAGAFTGTGASRFEGGFAPGNSPALVNVSFQATFSATSPVIMELGGTTPGNCATCADKIVFGNSVILEGGDLNVVWWNGHAGQAGDVYDLFDWNGGLTGAFGQVNLPTLAAGLAWDTGHLYTTGELSILAAPVPEPDSWALLLAGSGLVGGLARRRARAAAVC